MLHYRYVLQSHFSSWPAVPPQYCIKFVLQVQFFILSSSITSILHPVCTTSPIFHPVQQHQLSTAANLCFKFHFSSCSAASPQCCSKYVLKFQFFILPRSITSTLHQVCVASQIRIMVLSRRMLLNRMKNWTFNTNLVQHWCDAAGQDEKWEFQRKLDAVLKLCCWTGWKIWLSKQT